MSSCYAGEAKSAAAETAEKSTTNGKAAEPEAVEDAMVTEEPEAAAAAVKEEATEVKAEAAAVKEEEAAAPEDAAAAGKEAAAEKVEEEKEEQTVQQFVPGLLVRFDFGEAEHDLSYEDIKGAFGRAMAFVEFQKARCMHPSAACSTAVCSPPRELGSLQRAVAPGCAWCLT